MTENTWNLLEQYHLINKMTEEHTIEIRQSTYKLLEHTKDEDQTVQEYLQELLEQ